MWKRGHGPAGSVENSRPLGPAGELTLTTSEGNAAKDAKKSKIENRGVAQSDPFECLSDVILMRKTRGVIQVRDCG